MSRRSAALSRTLMATDGAMRVPNSSRTARGLLLRDLYQSGDILRTLRE